MKKYLISDKGRFFKANLHCHSTVSDGRLSPEEIKKAYMEKDKEMLKKLADEEFPPMQILVRQVYEAFRTLWYRENKSIGFEMQEMRFGALLLRNENCQRMIYEYLNGQLPVIQELELPRLPGHYGKEGKGERFNSYIQTISTSSSRPARKERSTP